LKTAIALIGAAALALLLLAEHRGWARLNGSAKPAASAAFIAFALASGAGESAYGRLILAGLALSFLGDVLLIAKRERFFLAGMGAFALGHLAYAGAFSTIWAGPSLLFFGAAFGVAAAIGATLQWLWPHLGRFRGPVAAYCAIIAVMTAMSFATLDPAGAAPYRLAVAGAVGFAASDISVARDQFVRPGFVNRALGLPLYYGAQMLLAASVSL